MHSHVGGRKRSSRPLGCVWLHAVWRVSPLAQASGTCSLPQCFSPALISLRKIFSARASGGMEVLPDTPAVRLLNFRDVAAAVYATCSLVSLHRDDVGLFGAELRPGIRAGLLFRSSSAEAATEADVMRLMKIYKIRNFVRLSSGVPTSLAFVDRSSLLPRAQSGPQRAADIQVLSPH
jgi:hypothetical protein